MAWTSPKTWSASEYVTAALMNTNVRDNFNYLYDTIQGGWRDADPDETWVYATAYTFTIEGNYTTKYTVGTKIKVTQTSAKYFYVVKSDYVDLDDNTVITVYAGNVYTLEDAAIASPQYSYENPPDFPYTFNCTLVETGFSSAPTNTVYRFSMNGNLVCFEVRQATPGTSNATTFTIPLPVTAKTVTNMAWYGSFIAVDAGTTQTTPGLGIINSAGTSLNLYKTWALGAWTNSGNKSVNGCIFYEV